MPLASRISGKCVLDLSDESGADSRAMSSHELSGSQLNQQSLGSYPGASPARSLPGATQKPAGNEPSQEST